MCILELSPSSIVISHATSIDPMTRVKLQCLSSTNSTMRYTLPPPRNSLTHSIPNLHITPHSIIHQESLHPPSHFPHCALITCERRHFQSHQHISFTLQRLCQSPYSLQLLLRDLIILFCGRRSFWRCQQRADLRECDKGRQDQFSE